MEKSFKISTSTELMSNFKQIELFDQHDEFKAVQTSDGHSMFFGQSTENTLHLVLEQSGQNTGWEKFNLCAGLVGPVKTFAVSQNHHDNHIDIAVVIADPEEGDRLYAVMNLSNSDLSWVGQPLDWSLLKDDRIKPGNPVLEICDVHLSETKNGDELFIVDTDDGRGYVARYWLDANSTQVWNAHPLAFNISSSDSDKSVIGRKSGEQVDGIYTLGEEHNVAQMVYTPLFNYFSSTAAPNPTNFDLSETGITGENASFATCKALSGADGETDLFIGGAGGLFYLASVNQSQMAKPEKLLENDIFKSLHELQAAVHENRVIVWGLNRSDQIFYTSCDTTEISNPSAWSVPLPLMSEVSQISQYVQNQTGALTIFATTGDGVLCKAIQDPKSSRWTFSAIELPAPDVTMKAKEKKSYTTSIHVTDQNDLPAAGAEITLIPDGHTHVYINHVYYALTGEPVTVKTDVDGTLSIVEWVDGLTGTRFNVSAGAPSDAVAIIPSDGSMDKMKGLGSVGALEKARIKGHDGSEKSLLPSGLTTDDKQMLADSIKSLNNVHDRASGTLPRVGVNAGLTPQLELTAQVAVPVDYIEVLWGDLVKSLEHLGEHVVKLVEDTVNDVVHFIVQVGEAIYGFVVDTVEKVAGALQAIWKRICKAFEDLWNFLKYIFDWDDMLLTKDVYKQITKIYLKKACDDVGKEKEKLHDAFEAAKTAIDEWAAQPGAGQPDLGSSDHSLHETLKGKPKNPGTNSAPGQFLKSHFAGNVHKSQVTDTSGEALPASISYDQIGISSEENAKTEALNKSVMNLLVTSTGEQANLDLSVILKKIVAEIADAALDLCENAADKLMDLMIEMLDGLLGILDAPIFIPVVGDIVSDMFGYHEPLTLLDILCMIAAVPATIGYKIIEGKAPFVTGDDTIHGKLVQAKTYADLKKLFDQDTDEITLDPKDTAVLFEMCYVAGGIFTILNGIFVVIDEEGEGGASSTMSTPMAVTSVLSSITVGLGGLFSLPVSVKQQSLKRLSTVLSILNLLTPLVLRKSPVAKAGAGALLGTIGLVFKVYNIGEICADKDMDAGLRTLSIMEATQGITSRLAKVAAFAAVVDKEKDSQQIILIVQGVLVVITGGLQIAEAVTEGVIDNS